MQLMLRTLPVVGLIGAVAVAVALAAPPPGAVACSLALVPLEQTVEGADAVIVGETFRERQAGSHGSLPVYESTVRVAAVLQGTPPREITLSQLGFLGAACEGGPRLPEGERVLLVLGKGTLGHESEGDWQVRGYEGGKYVLVDGRAENALFPPGDLEEVLRRVANVTGASPEQLDAAIAFALGAPAPAPPVEAEPMQGDPDDDGGPPLFIIALVAGGSAVLLSAAVAGAWWARRVRRAAG
jgi:hypothetical protein